MSLFAAKSSQVTRAILIFDLDLERTHWWAELTSLTAWAYELEQLGLARTCKALMDRQAWNGACTSCGTAGRAQKEAFLRGDECWDMTFYATKLITGSVKLMQTELNPLTYWTRMREPQLWVCFRFKHRDVLRNDSDVAAYGWAKGPDRPDRWGHNKGGTGDIDLAWCEAGQWQEGCPVPRLYLGCGVLFVSNKQEISSWMFLASAGQYNS